MQWTLAYIEKMKSEGKIRGYVVHSKSNKGERKRLLQKVGKQKFWMQMILVNFCSENNLTLETELKFSQTRKFRFDFAILELKSAFEYEGIFSEKSRHTSINGYSNDTDKYNLAASEGWNVYRYTAKNYKTLSAHLQNLKK